MWDFFFVGHISSETIKCLLCTLNESCVAYRAHSCGTLPSALTFRKVCERGHQFTFEMLAQQTKKRKKIISKKLGHSVTVSFVRCQCFFDAFNFSFFSCPISTPAPVSPFFAFGWNAFRPFAFIIRITERDGKKARCRAMRQRIQNVERFRFRERKKK